VKFKWVHEIQSEEDYTQAFYFSKNNRSVSLLVLELELCVSVPQCE